jgi:anti-sigma factor RsiW
MRNGQLNCQQCLERLGAYLDGELDGEMEPLLRSEVDGHLSQCLGCRRLVANCRQTIQVYRRQPLPELPAALHQKVMARVAAREKLGR